MAKQSMARFLPMFTEKCFALLLKDMFVTSVIVPVRCIGAMLVLSIILCPYQTAD
jgi:hypothetical protein